MSSINLADAVSPFDFLSHTSTDILELTCVPNNKPTMFRHQRVRDALLHKFWYGLRMHTAISVKYFTVMGHLSIFVTNHPPHRNAFSIKSSKTSRFLTDQIDYLRNRIQYVTVNGSEIVSGVSQSSVHALYINDIDLLNTNQSEGFVLMIID